MGKKKWKSEKTYPEPIWEKDPVDETLSFNVAMTYKIHLKQMIVTQDTKDQYYTCGHCKKGQHFYIEKNDKNTLKCKECNSIIQTS